MVSTTASRPTSSVRAAAARHNVLVRHYGEDHPAVKAAARDLDAARREAALTKAVDDIPPIFNDPVACARVAKIFRAALARLAAADAAGRKRGDDDA